MHVTGFDVTFVGNAPPARTVRIEATGVDPVVVERTPPGICTAMPHIDGLHPEIVVVVLDAMGTELARETFHPD